jgi:hypothetical protein
MANNNPIVTLFGNLGGNPELAPWLVGVAAAASETTSANSLRLPYLSRPFFPRSGLSTPVPVPVPRGWHPSRRLSRASAGGHHAI